jgi:hypothetical protein
MPENPNISKLFTNLDDAPKLDVDSVLRRARRRRLPRQLAAGGVVTLAIGGLFVGGAFAFTPNQPTISAASDAAPEAPANLYADGDDVSSLASGSATESSLATGDELKRSPADRINLCTGALAETIPSQTGLVVTTHFDDAAAGSAVVRGTVTLTNTGTSTITGTSGSWVSITLSQDDVVLWHTNGSHDMLGREITLAPGGSIEYDASFEPVTCTVDDDLAEGFPAGLPPVAAGEYQVSAAIDIVIDSTAELVTGPTANITLK